MIGLCKSNEPRFLWDTGRGRRKGWSPDIEPGQIKSWVSTLKRCRLPISCWDKETHYILSYNKQISSEKYSRIWHLSSAGGHIYKLRAHCKIYTINYAGRLGITIIVIFPYEALKPAHNIACGPLKGFGG